MKQNPPEIIVCNGPDDFARKAARRFLEIGETTISAKGRVHVALSGGKTPPALFRLLATDKFRRRIDWSRVHVFWGDERCVPPDDMRSNYRMAYETLISKVEIPEGNIHRIKGERGEEAADEYEEEIKRVFHIGEGAFPEFDLMLQGLGEDGHTASLFPGTGAVREERRIVTSVSPETVETTRITLTPPILNSALNVLFLVSGGKKAAVLREVIEGEYRPDRFPAQIARHSKGRVQWYMDREAAAILMQGSGEQ
ncbi:MAG: 6-phosphogluconolactonase [Thermodesulfobacteriota bacterium]